jgi:hypothetical protein
MNDYFYYSSFRRYIKIFGSLFSNVHVKRIDPYGIHDIDITVPIRYGNKSKMYIDITQNNSNANRPGEVLLPAMSFTIDGIDYDLIRSQTDSVLMKTNLENGSAKWIDTPKPFDLLFTLYVWTKFEDDLYQILEQILVFIYPQIAVNIREFPSFNINRLIRIIPESNAPDAEIGADLTEDASSIRISKWRFTFRMKCYLYNIIKTSAIIKEVNTNWKTYDPYTGDIDENSEIRGEQYRVKPFNSIETDNYQIEETISEDGKIYNKVIEK